MKHNYPGIVPFVRWFVILFFGFSLHARAQLTITNLTPTEIVSHLLGCSSAASNITMNCASDAAGFFTAFNTNLGLDSGIIFTSGLATNAIGPNNSCCQGYDNGYGGNSQLQSLCGHPTFNACVLDFDVTLNTDTLRFKYVFGSDEYSEWVGTSYNDVFALWISGPGIIGNQNMALVPNSTFPVTISNINCQGNSPYYVCNDPANTICSGAFNCPANQSVTTLQYDGFTTVLEAKMPVQAGQSYHLEFAIADANDPIYDSGVFVDADFLEPYHVSFILDSTNFVNPIDSTVTIVEGCTPGVLNFDLAETHTDTVAIPIIIGGTATNGVDYTTVNDTIIFYPYDSVESVLIGAFADGITEGTETVIIYSVDPCSGLPTDSVSVNIIDDFPFTVSNDTTVCENTPANLSATYSPYYSYSWTPANSVACDTCSTTTGTSAATTLYVVGVGLGTCINYDSVLVTVDVINPEAGNDENLCLGDTTQLFASGGTAYSWSPANTLSDANVFDPYAFPSDTTDYIVTVTGNYLVCHDYDTVRINVVPNLVGIAGDDTTVCPGFDAHLWAAGGATYAWTPNTAIDDSASASPTVNPLVSTTYQVVITNSYGCLDTQKVVVNVFPDPVITVNQPYYIHEGETAQLFAHGGVGSSYYWSPPDYLSDRTIYNPTASPDSDIYYTVKIISDQGCIYYDSTSVHLIYETLITFPTAFTPNHDGVNDIFSYISRGVFDLTVFKIFDRWGNVVFSSSSFDQGWDGTFSGKDEEMGAYVYVLTGKDGYGHDINKKGSFLLLR